MPMDFYIDPLTGDIDLTNNIARRTVSVEELARQQVAITLNTFRGEWIYNTIYGVPYLENDYNDLQLLGKESQNLIDSYINQAILSVEAISGITSYTSTVDEKTRKMSISFKATTRQGELISFDTVIDV